MAWTLVPSLVSLRAEFDRLAPARDHASDGSIGDGEHSQNSSDHNPDETGKTPTEDADSKNDVHAIVVDRDLKRSGWSMERAVQIIVLRHRSGVDNRLQNVIYNRRIWSRSWNWTARAYTGPNPHDHQTLSIAAAPAPHKIAEQIYTQAIQTQMAVRYFKGEALEKTFDGEHPCALCEHIRSAKKETQHDKAPQPESSPLVGVLVPGIVAWEPPAVPFAYPGFESRALARPFVPPTPPPRCTTLARCAE